MKYLKFALLVLICALAAPAQAPAPAITAPAPFDPTSVVKAMSDSSTWTTQATALLNAHDVAIKSLTDQSAAIAALKTQLAADEARITALETALKSLQAKTQSAGTTLATP